MSVSDASTETWLALLRATLHIDLRHHTAADSFLVTARQLADQADHSFIQATAQEGRAWAEIGDRPRTRRVLDRAVI